MHYACISFDAVIRKYCITREKREPDICTVNGVFQLGTGVHPDGTTSSVEQSMLSKVGKFRNIPFSNLFVFTSRPGSDRTGTNTQDTLREGMEGQDPGRNM